MTLPASIFQIARSVSTLTLATTDPKGNPHAAPVYFAHDNELNLYFFSETKSQHGQDIARNPRAAAAIYPECEGWQDIRGVQLRGEVLRVESGETREKAWGLYKNKFPFVKALKAIVARNQMYVLVPNWMRLVDNTQGFGYKQEFRFSDSTNH